ncbi:maleylpyruvate isomerase family mycothiol-dependent enzyme [Jatrophihabitans sp.]|uniref:maleylpyruvate isomerase family mycothiol-dependent enzyme n=1 Tax=Jatrophihabitans sp. TaxID=1932789 RepID=UPI0030C6B5B9|nr:hypothetical protein [Jatrophihabitans sp.]
MDVAALTEQLTEHGTRLADAAERAGLDTPVPSCPEWDVRALLAHVGMVHRWAATTVRGGRGTADDYPAPETGVVEWFRDGHDALVAALRGAPGDLAAWTFLPAASPLTFWARRQAHETAIHRADAEAAASAVPVFDPGFALDGLGELLEGFHSRRGGHLKADPGFVLHVVPADAAVTWSVQVRPDGRTVTRDGGPPADCTLSGAATDLYLQLWNRTPAGPVTVTGDERALTTWRELARITWS